MNRHCDEYIAFTDEVRAHGDTNPFLITMKDMFTREITKLKKGAAIEDGIYLIEGEMTLAGAFIIKYLVRCHKSTQIVIKWEKLPISARIKQDLDLELLVEEGIKRLTGNNHCKEFNDLPRIHRMKLYQKVLHSVRGYPSRGVLAKKEGVLRASIGCDDYTVIFKHGGDIEPVITHLSKGMSPTEYGSIVKLGNYSPAFKGLRVLVDVDGNERWCVISGERDQCMMKNHLGLHGNVMVIGGTAYIPSLGNGFVDKLLSDPDDSWFSPLTKDEAIKPVNPRQKG